MAKAKKAERHDVDPNSVKRDDLMAFTYWARVESNQPVGRRFSSEANDRKLTVRNVDTDAQFDVIGNPLISGSMSADQFVKTKRTKKTEFPEILSNAKNVPFTVKFEKADGSPRVLRGRLIGVDQKNLGYIDVEDLDIDDGNRFRMVDCRTIQYIIVGGVKYTK